jgi:hypothetical protein
MLSSLAILEPITASIKGPLGMGMIIPPRTCGCNEESADHEERKENEAHPSECNES